MVHHLFLLKLRNQHKIREIKKKLVKNQRKLHELKMSKIDSTIYERFDESV